MFVVTGMPGQQIPLGLEAVEQFAGGEPAEVQLLGGVDEARCVSRRDDLLPVGVPLGPERGAPRLVERVDRVVPLA
jgi:hypothetical protein